MTEIADLYRRSADYFILQDGQTASDADAEELFTDVPDQRIADQLVLGWYDGADLIAVAAVLPDYPRVDVWYLGFLIVDPAMRGRGIGRTIYSQIASAAAEAGATEMRLAVLEVNDAALRFWRSLGFRVRRRSGPDAFKSIQHHRIELYADLGA